MTETAPETKAAPRWLLLAAMLLGIVGLLAVAVATLSLLPENGSAHPETELVTEQAGGAAQVNLVAYGETEFYVVRLPDGSLKALGPEVTAARTCTVVVRDFAGTDLLESSPSTAIARDTGLVFRDPCSGSTFDLAGIRFFGPAARNLVSYPASENADGSLDVQIDAPVCTTGGLMGEPRPVAC